MGSESACDVDSQLHISTLNQVFCIAGLSCIRKTTFRDEQMLAFTGSNGDTWRHRQASNENLPDCRSNFAHMMEIFYRISINNNERTS